MISFDDLVERAANGDDVGPNVHRDIACRYLEAVDEIDWLRRRLDEVKRELAVRWDEQFVAGGVQ